MIEPEPASSQRIEWFKETKNASKHRSSMRKRSPAWLGHLQRRGKEDEHASLNQDIVAAVTFTEAVELTCNLQEYLKVFWSLIIFWLVPVQCILWSFFNPHVSQVLLVKMLPGSIQGVAFVLCLGSCSNGHPTRGQWNILDHGMFTWDVFQSQILWRQRSLKSLSSSGLWRWWSFMMRSRSWCGWVLLEQSLTETCWILHWSECCGRENHQFWNAKHHQT